MKYAKATPLRPIMKTGEKRSNDYQQMKMHKQQDYKRHISTAAAPCRLPPSLLSWDVLIHWLLLGKT